ncbi:MAG: hypothetical protein ACK4E0_11585 [Chitinophagaceae bacterium]
MKWEKVTSTIGQSAYTLWNNGRKLVTLVFNPSSNAARIESASEKRVFLIRKEGFLRNRTVLRNEYGVQIGYAGSENNRNYIELDNQRFFYEVEESAQQPSVSIYSADRNDAPLAVCQFDNKEKNNSQPADTKKPLHTQTQYSLLMALCWYLLPFVKENRLDLQLA